LITGANRGLGLEFVKQYLADGWRVFAACRTPAEASELSALAEGSEGRVSVHRLDVSDLDQVGALGDELGGETLDVLVNNAGTFGDRGGFGQINYPVWETTFRANTLGPVRLAEVLIGALERGDQKVIANITSKMGSIDDNGSGGEYVYRTTKAALNMATKSLAIDLGRRGVKAVVIHPGWVRTDMGGPAAPLGAAESVAGMRAVVAGLKPADSGRFLNYDGSEIPW
jgi:NAD(P)-dependent dehydrogenase (short-subunit alcohol dehydrogenase family)